MKSICIYITAKAVCRQIKISRIYIYHHSLNFMIDMEYIESLAIAMFFRLGL
jgi:hypothetical protein